MAGPGEAAAAGVATPAKSAVPKRVAGWWPEVASGVAGVTTLVVVGLLLAEHLSPSELLGELLWAVGGASGVAAAVVVRWRRPDHPLSAWFVVMVVAGPVSSAFDTSLYALARIEAPGGAFAAVTLLSGLVGLVGAVAAFHLLSRLPDGRIRWRLHATLLRGMWLVVPAFVLIAVAVPTVLVPWYAGLPEVANPLHVTGISVPAETAYTLVGLLQGVPVLAAIVLLVLRYRHLTSRERRGIRWLLVPMVVVVIGLTINVMFRESGQVLLNVLFLLLQPMLAVAVAMVLLTPTRLDPDRVLRRSLVYGLLWLAIAATYVAAGAAIGVTAGHRLPVEGAAMLTVLATLAFQPARRGLERVADRWVFGPRSDPARVVARLGATLAETFDLQELLPRMAATLETGLGLRWADVRLHGFTPAVAPATGAEPGGLCVPITLGDDHVGMVECGPRKDGRPLTQEDQAVVETLARQAALAVHNLRLTRELQTQADELAASRARLVRAQEGERRRIERNIHDGVQQGLVALIGQAGRMQAAETADTSMAPQLLQLHTGLRRVLADLRELAAGIHPSLLSDHGLLAAVEALAARHPVPVNLRADPGLRDLRLPAEIEGASYFTVAEALTNSLKHAHASRIEVTLSRSNGSLLVTVGDDGVGFDNTTTTAGQGLANLTERVAALGGQLALETAPGRGTTVTATLAIDPAGPG